ncbi:uncharacterized protein LOC144628208 [Oculina patagonica]
MSSIVTAVFKATIALLVNKGRDKAAEKLRDGDVADQKFRGLIVRELDDIKSKLDGLSRKDLLASISFFEEGIELLYVVFDKARTRSEHRGEETAQAACAEAFSLAEGMRNLELTGLDESATRALSNAKKRFEDARREATRAFKNEALDTSDRILAMEYRVMATILEAVDNPADAVAPCRVCIKELNCLPAVQNSFDVQLKKGIQAVRSLFSKDERRKIISSVCHVNRVIYEVTQAVGEDEPFWMWPAVDTSKGKVDPLRDGRITEVLCKQGMEHCCVVWSLGRDCTEYKHLLQCPGTIATNSSGQFIATELDVVHKDPTVKVFDSSGKFMDLFSLNTADFLNQEVKTIFDVATDMNDNFYVLLKLHNPSAKESEIVVNVYEFDYSAGLHHKFPVKECSLHSRLFMTVDVKRKVLVLGETPAGRNALIYVYETDGRFVRSFGEGLLKFTSDITAASDGRVMVMDAYDYYVHIFGEQGDHLNKFKLEGCPYFPKIAFHGASKNVVVADVEESNGRLHVQIYTDDGAFVRSTQIQQNHKQKNAHKCARVMFKYCVKGMTVTTKGHIAVVLPYVGVLVMWKL